MKKRNFKSFYTDESKYEAAQNMASLREYANINEFQMVDDHLLLSIIHDTLYHERHDFIRAVEEGNMDVVQYIVEVVFQEGYEQDYKKKVFHYALKFAAKGGHLNIIEYFVHLLGDDFDGRNPSVIEAVGAAAENGHVDILIYFEELGARFINEDDMINHAARNGHLEVIEYLLSSRRERISIYNIMNNALLFAINNNHFEVGVYLIENSDMEVLVDSFFATLDNALISAAGMGSMAFVRYLAENGASSEDLALSQAVLNRQWEVVDYLLSVGADPYASGTRHEDSAVGIAENELSNHTWEFYKYFNRNGGDLRQEEDIEKLMSFLRQARRTL